MNNKLKNGNKGITLIALIITIIVMLILVVIAVSVAINSGLFGYAGKAVKDTESSMEEEQWIANGGVQIGDSYYTIDEYIEQIAENKGNRIKLTYTVTPAEDNLSAVIKVNAKMLGGLIKDYEKYEEWALKKLEGKTEEEKIQMFIDGDVFWYPEDYEEIEQVTLEDVLSVWEAENLEQCWEEEYETFEAALISWGYVYPEEYEYWSDYYTFARSELRGKTEEEIEEIFVEGCNYWTEVDELEMPIFNNIDELVSWTGTNYANGEYNDVAGMLEYYGPYETLADMAIDWSCVRPEKFVKIIDNELIIITPDGTEEYGNTAEYTVYTNGEYTFVATNGPGTEINAIKVDIDLWKVAERVEKNTEYIDTSVNPNKTAVIPAGFTVSGVASEQTIAGGLVIYEIPEGSTVDWTTEAGRTAAKESYNQFVWIPVEKVEDMYICHKFNTDYDGTEGIGTEEAKPCEFEIAQVTEGEETAEKIKCKTHNSYDMAGYLYTDHAMTTRITSYTPNSGKREPGLVDGKQDGTGTSYDKASTVAGRVTTYTNLKKISDILGKTGYNTPDNFLQTMQKDYNEIATSILKYKGFYVGRYESSNISATDTGSLVVQAGKTPTNNTDWYTMYAKQKAYKVNDKAVGSTMINSAAYNQVIKFVNNGTRPDGEPYTALTEGNVAHDSSQGITGVYETGNTNYPSTATVEYNDLVKNIYDLEGNVTAWITEASYTDGRFGMGRQLRRQLFSF